MSTFAFRTWAICLFLVMVLLATIATCTPPDQPAPADHRSSR